MTTLTHFTNDCCQFPAHYLLLCAAFLQAAKWLLYHYKAFRVISARDESALTWSLWREGEPLASFGDADEKIFHGRICEIAIHYAEMEGVGRHVNK